MHGKGTKASIYLIIIIFALSILLACLRWYAVQKYCTKKQLSEKELLVVEHYATELMFGLGGNLCAIERIFFVKTQSKREKERQGTSE